MQNTDVYKKLLKISTTLDGNVTNEEVKGAVVFLFVQDHLLLIQRSENMTTHKGQLAFIGGHREESDNDLIETAIREFKEETDRHIEDIEFMGILPPVATMQSKLITPVLAHTHETPHNFIEQIKSNGEWDEAIIVKYQSLMDMNFWTHAKTYSNRKDCSILFRSLKHNDVVLSSQNQKEHFVLWGATARMIWNFHHEIWSKV